MAQTDNKLPPFESTDEFVHTDLPEWLLPEKIHTGPPYTEHTLEKIFQWCASGRPLSILLREDPTMPEMGELMRFLHKNPKLLNDYYDAQQAGTESITDRVHYRSMGYDEDGSPTMDDPARIKLEVDNLKWLAGSRNAKRYGEKKQVDITNKVDISEALQAADQRRLAYQRPERTLTIDNETGSVDED